MVQIFLCYVCCRFCVARAMAPRAVDRGGFGGDSMTTMPRQKSAIVWSTIFIQEKKKTIGGSRRRLSQLPGPGLGQLATLQSGYKRFKNSETRQQCHAHVNLVRESSPGPLLWTRGKEKSEKDQIAKKASGGLDCWRLSNDDRRWQWWKPSSWVSCTWRTLYTITITMSLTQQFKFYVPYCSSNLI
jgi:hypothetical protein